MEEREPVSRLNLFDLLALIVRWHRLFIVNFVVVVAVAVVVALRLPVWFSATTVILPPGGGSSGGIPSFLSKDLVGIAAGFGLELPTEEIYQTVLGSRTLKENIIERFDLRRAYRMPEDAFPEDVIKAFEGHMGVETRRDLSIAVTVEDGDPERAAAIANACVEELDRIYRDITSETARKNRIFIERRLQQVIDSLAAIEDSMQAFQERTKAVSIPEQVVALISAAADMKAKQLAKDVELEVLRSSFGEDHPMVAQLAKASREMEEKYNRLLSGSEGGLFLALKDLPELARQYAELYRRTEIQSTLLEYIYPQYESARIKELRETANVQVLDRAKVPNRKSRPPRRMIVMVAAVGSFLATLVLILLLEYWRSLPDKSAEDWAKVQRIFGAFRRRR